MKRAVVDLAAARPAWRFGPRDVERVRRAFGRGWEVVAVRAAADSDGDGGSGSAEAVEAARGAHVYLGWGVPRGVVRAASDSLRWAHTCSVGVGSAITPELRATGAVLTNARGVHAEPMADWVISAVGAAFRGFLPAAVARAAGRWDKDAFTNGSVPLREFTGARLGLIGLGGIGAAVAHRAAALGMEVRAVRRHPRKRRPRGVRWVGGPDELPGLAAASDVLVVAAPLTAATRALVGGALLDVMPAGAVLLNVARGALVDEVAVVERLNDGRLAAFITDVVAHEPPGSDSPLWTHPGVFLTPHVSAVTPRFRERATAQIIENIGRFRGGRRLRNVVDLEAGY